METYTQLELFSSNLTSTIKGSKFNSKVYYQNNRESILEKNKAYQFKKFGRIPNKRGTPKVKLPNSTPPKTDFIWYREMPIYIQVDKNPLECIWCSDFAQRKYQYKSLNDYKQYLCNKLRHIVKCLVDNKQIETENLLGCSFEEAKLYFESQFSETMNWSNRSKWHIDHIKPVSLFIEKDVHLMNHISNLQPLWIADNLLKADTWC